MTPVEALSLYGRHWRHLDRDALDPKERALLEALRHQEAKGRLLV